MDIFTRCCLIGALSIITISASAQPYHFSLSNQPKSNQSIQIAAGDINEVSTPGAGYSSDKEKVVGSCLIGTVEYSGGGEGYVDYLQSVAYDQVTLDLKTNFSANVGYKGVFNADTSAEFSHWARNTSFSETFFAKGVFTLKPRKFITPTDKNPLSWIGQQYSTDPSAFREYCGDKYVVQQGIGGEIFLAVKLNFATTEDKQTFHSKIKGNLSVKAFSASASKEIAQAIDSISKRGNIEVRAYQIGGDTSQLVEILHAEDGEANSLNCSLDSLEDCQELISQLTAYAANNFKEQFKSDDIGSFTGPAVLSYVTKGYKYVVPVKIAASQMNKAIQAARLELAHALEQQENYRARITNLLDNFKLNPNEQHVLLDVLSAVKYNSQIIRQTGLDCYDNLSTCETMTTEAMQKLIAIDESVLGYQEHSQSEFENGRFHVVAGSIHPEHVQLPSTDAEINRAVEICQQFHQGFYCVEPTVNPDSPYRIQARDELSYPVGGVVGFGIKLQNLPKKEGKNPVIQTIKQWYLADKNEHILARNGDSELKLSINHDGYQNADYGYVSITMTTSKHHHPVLDSEKPELLDGLHVVADFNITFE